MFSESKPGAIIIEGHVQGLANMRALGKVGIPVVVVDVSQCVAASSKYCKQFYLSPAFNSKEFIPFLINLVEENQLHGWVLIPSNDHIVYNIAENRVLLKKYVKFTIPPIETVKQICEKTRLLDLAEEKGVPIPKTFCFNSPEQEILTDFVFPVITKGKEGLSFYKALGTKAFLSNDKDQLKNHLQIIEKSYILSSTFTQELIRYDGTNKTLSLAAFCIDGEIKAYWMGVKLREHPLQFGTATFAESVFVKECLDYSRTLLGELDYTGVCEVEFLQDPNDGLYKLIEINPRTWLWVGHAIACGVNFPLYIYNYLNGIDNEYATSYTLGLKWKNIYSDSIYSIIGLVKKNISIKKWRIQNKGTKVDALWDRDDKKPFFVYGKLMFKFLKNR